MDHHRQHRIDQQACRSSRAVATGYRWANFYAQLSDLDKVDWSLLQSRDFRRDPADPGKFERYQAEVLIYQHCPVSSLMGIICYTDEVKSQIESQLQHYGLELAVYVRPGWYFQ